MNYKETLFFVAKCLTINHEVHNKRIVEETLQSNTVDWDEVVKLSTAHYVFPALYCNLKRASFLSYLPEDLVEYMKYITALNRERNEKIIAQAKELNTLLLKNHITPIFLKGTANLLDNLYEDIAERMLGDIDFIISDESYNQTVMILSKNQYNYKNSLLDDLGLGKHHPRMTHKNKIAAVEVHFRIVNIPYDHYLNYNTIKKNLQKTKDQVLILSDINQILHTVFNKQTNDRGYWMKTISLRNYYDLFLLSKKTNTLKSIQSIEKYFNILNSFLASCNFVFNNISSIHFKDDKKAKTYVSKVNEFLVSPKKMKFNKAKWNFYFKTKIRFKKLKLAFINKNARKHLYNFLLRH